MASTICEETSRSSTSSMLVSPLPFSFGLSSCSLPLLETHMSLAQLSNGKFLLLDGVPGNPNVVPEIKRLTSDGKDLEAVIHTHPFHTGAVVDLHKEFPEVPIYGCPRHLKMFSDLPWAGDLNDETVRKKWEPDVEMRIPAGRNIVKFSFMICLTHLTR